MLCPQSQHADPINFIWSAPWGGPFKDLASISDDEKIMAEGEGFEPPVGLPTTVFKTAALNRSAIPPQFFGAKFMAPIEQIVVTFLLKQTFTRIGRGLSIGMIAKN